MKQILLLLGIIIMFSECKKDDSPASTIESIVGRWRQTETKGNDENSWVKSDTSSQSYYINVLSGGLIVNDKGFLPCCPPESLTINGTLVKITKNTDPIRFDPFCASVNCAPCLNLIIQQTGNEMVITSCGGYQQKYVREQLSNNI